MNDKHVEEGLDHRFGHSNGQIFDCGMRNQLRLNKKIDDLQRQWELLNKKLSELNNQEILETRVEEKLRLRNLINDIQTQRDQVEENLKDMESQLTKVDSDAKKVAGRNDDQDIEEVTYGLVCLLGLATIYAFMALCFILLQR